MGVEVIGESFSDYTVLFYAVLFYTVLYFTVLND